MWDMDFSFMMGIIILPRLVFPGTGGIIQGVARDAYFLFYNWLGPEYGEGILKFAVTFFFYLFCYLYEIFRF